MQHAKYISDTMHDSPYPLNCCIKIVITRLASNICLKYKQAFRHIIVVVGRTAPQFTIPQIYSVSNVIWHLLFNITKQKNNQLTNVRKYQSILKCISVKLN